MGRWKRKWEIYFSLKNKEGSHMKKWNLYIHRTDCERSFFFFFNQKLKEYVQKLILEEIAVTNHNMFTWGNMGEWFSCKTTCRAKRIPIAGNTKFVSGCTYQSLYVPLTLVVSIQKTPVIKVDTSGIDTGTIATYKVFGTGEVKDIDALRIDVSFKGKDKTFHCLRAFAQGFLFLED